MTKRETKPSPTSDERSKKIGDRKETIVVRLTPAEIEEQKSNVCELLGRIDNLQAALKATKASYKAKLDAVDEQISVALQCSSSGKREIEIDVEEWLTRGNEIVRVRVDTGEVLGRRTARMEELQESMFPPDPPSTGDAFPSPEDAFGGPS